MGWTVYNSDGQILQGSSTLADDAVTTAKILNLAVTNAKLADDAVGADELAANAVVNASIASGAAIEFSKMENLTNSRLLVSDGSGDVSVSAVTAAEILQLAGLSANVTDTNLNALTAGSGNTTLHSHAAGSPAEHGASAHTNLTRYIFMPPGPVHTNCVYEPNRLALIKLPVNVMGTVNFTFQVPVDYDSHVAATGIRLVWYTNVSGGNVMYGRFGSYGQGVGESIEGTSENTSEETMTANANKLITVSNKSDYLDLTGIAAGDYIGIDFRRNGAHSSDTISDDVRCLGMLFTYTATQ